MAEDKTTYEVDELLKEMKPSELSKFYKENPHTFVDDTKAFYYYMKDVIDTKNILLKDIYIQAGVTESYGEQIIQMKKHTKNRDLIIRFCIAGHFSVVETNKALKLYGMNPLYSKDKRDACLIISINNRIYDLFEIDDKLEAQGFEKISKISK